MAKNSDYAAFSLDSYQKAEDNAKIPQNWRAIVTSDTYTLSSNGYFGIAYINSITNKLVITHRGTDSLFTDLGDDLALALSLATQQYTENAIPFVDQVKQRFKSQFPTLNPQAFITHTGHSLGGFLAELCATRDKVKAVTFDSPGSRQNIQKLVQDNKLPTDSITWADNNVITFLAAPDFVNTANYHVGKLYRVYSEYRPVDNQIQPDGIYYAKDYSLTNQHSMKGIYQQFLPNSDLPKSVQPAHLLADRDAGEGKRL